MGFRIPRTLPTRGLYSTFCLSCISLNRLPSSSPYLKYGRPRSIQEASAAAEEGGQPRRWRENARSRWFVCWGRSYSCSNRWGSCPERQFVQRWVIPLIFFSLSAVNLVRHGQQWMAVIERSSIHGEPSAVHFFLFLFLINLSQYTWCQRWSI